MKYIQSLLHFFFVSLGLIISTSKGRKVSDKLNPKYGRWIKNDIPRSFTYDCKGSKVLFELWGEVHGKNIRSLEIKNCSELSLSFSQFAHPISDNKRNFRYLTINDIGELWIEIQNEPGCFPSNLIIKNVDFVGSFYFPRSGKECEDLDLTLKSLVLKNVLDMSVLDSYLKYQNLSRLEMEEVYIDFAERNSLKLVNENGVVNISNSVIETAEPDFMNFNVSEVIFSGNTIQNFDESDRLFSFEADEVILNGNVMKKITNGTMKIISDNVKITENTIEWMDVNIFDNIQPNSMSNSFLNFSKNTIRFLSTNSSIDDSKIEIFANLTIADNVFSCSCHNISQVRAFRKFYLEWSKEANRNKCWNLPNCYIHQVLQYCGGLSENDNCSVEVNEKKVKLYNTDLNIEEKVDNDSFNLDTKIKSDISNEDINHSNLIIFFVSLILAFIICIIGFIMGYVVRIMYVKRSPNPNFYVKTLGK